MTVYGMSGYRGNYSTPFSGAPYDPNDIANGMYQRMTPPVPPVVGDVELPRRGLRQRLEGIDYGGIGRTVGGATIDAVKAVPGAVWRNPIGKAGIIGAGVLAGGRYVAYPLLSGMIDPETREKIGNNPVGQFVTGQDPNSVNLQSAIYDKKADEYESKLLAQQAAERAQMEEDYKRRAQFDSDLAYRNALRDNELGLSVGNAVTFRDIYANQLANSAGRYLESMRIANDSVRNILGYRVPVI